MEGVFHCYHRDETHVWTTWSSCFPLAVDKTPDLGSKTLLKSTRIRTSDIYAISLKDLLLFVCISFPCYTTDKQTFSVHFDFPVIVQYKRFSSCLMISFICNRIKSCILIKMHFKQWHSVQFRRAEKKNQYFKWIFFLFLINITWNFHLKKKREYWARKSSLHFVGAPGALFNSVAVTQGVFC